jgi:pimeloyl-ACP methyl ester carboxylesterase
MTLSIAKNMRFWFGAFGVLLGLSAVFVAPAGSAADIAGTWQATLLPGSPTPLRIVLKIARNDAGGLTATAYSIDQTPEAMPVESITLTGDSLALSVPDVRGTYAGKVSADGASIAGTWTQNRPRPLDFQRATSATAWPIGHVRSTQFVTVEKAVRLEVLDWGGTGRPVVLLAGLGNSAHIFDGFAVKLREKYHVYGITRRGFGESSAPPIAKGAYTADRLGDDVIAVIDALKINRPVLIGHSIAGEELSSVGTRRPEKVAGLVYLDAGYSYALYNPAYVEPTPPPGVTLPPVFQAVEAGRQRYAGPIRDPILAIFALPHDMKEMYVNDPAAQKAAEAEDLAKTGGQVEAFQRGLPSARVVRLPHANHYVFESNQAEVLTDVNAFISTLP